MLSLMNHDSSFGQVFNIGNEEQISIGGLADKIRSLVDPLLEIKMIPDKPSTASDKTFGHDSLDY